MRGKIQPLTRKCIACESHAIEYAFSKHKDGADYEIWRCMTCGSRFMNPRPSDVALNTIYARSGLGLTTPPSVDTILAMEKVFPFYSEEGPKMVGRAAALGRKSIERSDLSLLEIGSGYGFAAAAALKLGYSVVAINPSAWENEICTRMTGLHPLQSMFEDVELSNQKFGVAILCQVLEHIQEPRRTLAKVHALLDEGGILAVAVPNVNSLRVKLLGKADDACFWVPEHINYFSKRGLLSLLSETGFDPIAFAMGGRIPYPSLGMRLGLHGWQMKTLTWMTRIGQVVPLAVANAIEWGIYQYVWARRRAVGPTA